MVSLDVAYKTELLLGGVVRVQEQTVGSLFPNFRNFKR